MTEQLIMEENGKRYRMLMVGETLEAGDEVRLFNQWKPFHAQWIDEKYSPFMVREDQNGPFPVGYYRRSIAPHAALETTAVLESGFDV